MWNLTSSLALDAEGRAWVAYCDEDENDALYVAVRDEPTGIADMPRPTQVPAATLVRGVLRLDGLGTRSGSPERNSVMSRAALLDISGRKVMELQPGENDIRHLAPGVFFVREASGVMPDASTVHKVVIQR